MNIFVGNLSFSATEADIKKLFEGFGGVASVRIVLEKKGTKSRGFGFVRMPDEQQAQNAIAALTGKEFMGRPLNVSPVRPKPEVDRNKGEAKKIWSEIKHPGEENGGKDAWFNPVFHKKLGRYKTGRRSRSFIKRRAAAGIVEEVTFKRENRENPMRWQKKHEQPKPGQKKHEQPKPLRRVEGKSILWKKSEGEFKPWRKSVGESNPRRKSKRPRPHQSRIESRRKPGGYKR